MENGYEGGVPPLDFAARRKAMVRQLEQQGIVEPAILGAFALVPHERFVAEHDRPATTISSCWTLAADWSTTCNVRSSTTRRDRIAARCTTSGRATFLADKPVRGSLFYENLHPTPTLTPKRPSTSPTSASACRWPLLAPLTPVPLRLEATRAHNVGSSALRVVEDQIDDIFLDGERAVGKFGMTRYGYHYRQQGVGRRKYQPADPEFAVRVPQDLHVDTSLQLGSENQYQFNNNITFTQQRFHDGAGVLAESRMALPLS